MAFEPRTLALKATDLPMYPDTITIFCSLDGSTLLLQLSSIAQDAYYGGLQQLSKGNNPSQAAFVYLFFRLSRHKYNFTTNQCEKITL